MREAQVVRGPAKRFAAAAWKSPVLLGIASVVSATFVIGGGWILVKDVSLWWLSGLLVLASGGTFLAFDRLALDVGASVTMTETELRYEPGGRVLKRWVRKNSVYAPKVFQLSEWDFNWRREFQRTHCIVPFWIVEVVSRSDRQRIQQFRVTDDIMGIAQLRQITSAPIRQQA